MAVTWLDEHPEAVEAAAKLIHLAMEDDPTRTWDRLPPGSMMVWRTVAHSALAAALSAAAEGEPEYQWGVRAIHDGTVLGSDSEHDARQLHAMGGWELVRWRKAGPVEVVDE